MFSLLMFSSSTMSIEIEVWGSEDSDFLISTGSAYGFLNLPVIDFINPSNSRIFIFFSLIVAS